MSKKKTGTRKASKGVIDQIRSLEWERGSALASGISKSLAEKGFKELSLFTPFYDLIQAGLKGYGKEYFYSEIDRLIDKGKLPPKFWRDDLSRNTFLEITKIIDSENPSVDKIKAMEALLVVVANKDEKLRYEVSIHLDTLRQLDSLEFNIIMSSYRLRKNGTTEQKAPSTKDSWRRFVMEESGWDENMEYEIERRETHLIELRLIDSHPGRDARMLPQTTNCRLTGLAIKIGDIITSGQID